MKQYMNFDSYQCSLKVSTITNRGIASRMKCYHGESSSSSGSGTPQLTPQQFVDLYKSSLPQILGTVTGQTQPTATELANTTASTNPIYTQSGLDQLRNLAPGYQQAGAALQKSQAGSNLELLNGAGGNVARSAAALSNELNPTQKLAQDKSAELMNSINLNGLSNGEHSAVERSLNQSNYATGNLGVDNATTAVNNAMNFGNALSAKRAQLGQAIGTASGVAANQNQFVNPVNTAMNSGMTNNNFGLGTFNPVQGAKNAGAAFDFSTSLGSQLAGIGAASRTSSSGSGGGGGVCYLTTACCEFKGLSDNCEELTILRKFRDTFVPKDIVEQYYKLSNTIMPKVSGNKEVLSYIYEVITKCVTDIKANNKQAALDKYVAMVKILTQL